MCNEKIIDLISHYIETNEQLKKELEKKEKIFKSLQDTFNQYRKKSQKKLHCFKNKIELLGKCVNIAISKYEEFKAKTLDHPHMDIEV